MGAIARCAIYETDGLVKALDADGCVIVQHALAVEECSRAREKIDALAPLHWDEVHAGETLNATGRFLDRYLCVFNRDPYWLAFLDRPGIIDLAEAALGQDCHVIGQTAWRTHPGYTAEPLHLDYVPPTSFAAASRQIAFPVFLLTVHYYLSTVTRDLAPTRVVRGSQRAARAPLSTETHWNGSTADIVEAEAGDAFVFRSDVWHAGSDNRTAHGVRYLLQVHYGRREMAQHFSPFMAWQFNPGVLAAASKRQRRLLGDHEPGAYD